MQRITHSYHWSEVPSPEIWGWPAGGCLIGAEGYMDLNHEPLPCQGADPTVPVALFWAACIVRRGGCLTDRLTEVADRGSAIHLAATVPVKAARHAGWLSRLGERVYPVN